MRPTTIILSSLLLLLTPGCDHKEILCPGAEPRPIDVRFIWDKAPAAEVDGMTLFFYPCDGNGKVWRFDIAGDEGGRVAVPAGKYNLVSFNNDLPGITITGAENFTTISADARKTDESEGMVMPTGMLYGSVVEDVDVTLCGVRYRQDDGTVKECPYGVIRYRPDSMSNIYHIRFIDIKGGDHIASATAKLCGIGSGINLSDGLVQSGVCDVLCAMSGNDTSISTTTSGFAQPASDYPGQVTVTANIRCKTGHYYVKTYDVTEQVANFRNAHNVYINITGLDIPDDGLPDNPGEGSGAFDVGVSGWETVNIDLSND